jgi:PAS domain S-box-containing protein
MEVRLRLLGLADAQSMEELLRATLDEAEALTRSQVGFYHFLEADQATVARQVWSTNTAQVLALAGGSGGRHPVDPAGVWLDCVKERRPVVHNDYASLPNPGQAPPGGARLTRELAVPVIRAGKVAAVLGLGNKPTDYVQADIEAVMALADLAWDIASRKRAEEAHRASEERFRDFTFTLADFAWEMDAGSRFTYVSDSVRRVLGREAHEFLGRAPFEFMPPAEARRVGQIFDELAARKAPFTDLDNTMYHQDGTTRSLLTTAVPVLDQHGHLLGYRGTDKDITDRKRLESQLREAQKLEAVGQLAGGVAHDFNNLLSATMMHLSLMQENPSLDADTRQALKELEMESKRASNLTRQLLMFSRRSVLEIQVMDLNKVVANLVKMLGRLIGENISLKFLPCQETPAVEGDVGMMEQVLMNLVVNARDAMPRGGRLMISTSLMDLGPEFIPAHPERRPGRFVRLSVTDTGCGMDEATLKRIFEPFFTTKEAGVGTGLGLAIVHGIVAQHQGWVDVESQVGAGTAFRVYFKASASPVEGAVEAPKPKASRGHETILLVEDDDIVREIAQRCLEAFGYRVLAAANGQDAMVSWKKSRQDISLLFTDMVLPEGMTGLDLAEKLRAENPALKVIVCSGYNSEKLKRGIAAATGVVYLAKPFQADVLIQIVRESLDRNS